MLSRLKELFFPKKSNDKQWEKNEYFDPNWKLRIRQMAQWITPGESVVDLGCGQSWLKEFLPEDSNYTGVDYMKRDEDTIVCNFNSDPFPVLKGDCAFISGCLEYIEKPEHFINEVSKQYRKCIISYCTLEEFPDLKQRENLFWKNNLSKKQLIDLFIENGYTLKAESKTSTQNSIFQFKK